MNLDTWIALPTADWAGSLVGLALAIVSAAAAVYSSAHLSWMSDLEAAVDATVDEQGKTRNRRTAEGARALVQLKKIRAQDPAKGIGRVALAVSILMTVIGVIAGLQIPKVGYLFTVFPVLVAAAVSIGAVFLPGRDARTAADNRIDELTKAPQAAES